MNRFEIVGSRSDERQLSVDISYRDTAREARALTVVLAEITEKTGVRQSGFGSEDSQRYAFARVLSHMLQFSDEGNFAKGLPEKDRQKKLRTLAASVNQQMQDIVEGHRHRKVMTLRCSKPEDPEALLKMIRKALTAAG